MAIFDTNVSLGRWSFRRLAGDDTASLAARLKQRTVTTALAASFEALLHDDIAQVNVRTAEECAARGQGILLPVGAVNPRLPDWKEDLRRCVEVHKMRAIRLHPNYQGYALADPDVAALFALAERHNILVQIAVQMEDERTQHPVFHVGPVNLAPLPALVAHLPRLRVQVLNASRFAPGQARQLCAAGRVYLDIAMHEGALGLSNLLQQVPLDRVTFGSCFPLFYFESSQLKIREAGLDAAAAKAILFDNASRMLDGASR